jgi:hypothetical protein
MKFWLAPACVAMFLAGAAGGVVTKPSPKVPNLPWGREAAIRELPAAKAIPVGTPLPATPEPPAPFLCGSVARPDDSNLSPRMRALRRLLNRLDPEEVCENLWVVSDEVPALQRRAFDLFKESRDPDFWQRTVVVLDPVCSPEVIADALSLLQVERDPARRRFLAGLMAKKGQPEEFRTAVMRLLSDPDSEVVRSILREIKFKDFTTPEDRNHASAMMQAAAAPGRPQALRLQALESMTGMKDPRDVRFLLGLLYQEKETPILIGVMNALPTRFGQESSDLVIEMVRAFFAMATDLSLPLEVRKNAARAADRTHFDDGHPILTEAEDRLLMRIRRSEE